MQKVIENTRSEIEYIDLQIQENREKVNIIEEKIA